MPKKLILYIDDDEDVLQIVSIVLLSEGYRIIACESVPEISDLLAYHPDLILLDEWLKKDTGSDLCRQIRSHPSAKALPVILISAVNGLEQIASDCGADLFIAKPFDIDHLLKVIALILNDTDGVL